MNIGPNLYKKIPNNITNPTDYIPNTYTVNMYLNPTDPDEMSKIIDRLKDCASGWDCIPSSVLKSTKIYITTILSHIINLSLCQGIFPTELKLANVIPIFKAGDKQSTGNYRPKLRSHTALRSDTIRPRFWPSVCERTKSGIIRPGQAGVHRWFTQAGLALNRPKCAM